MDGYVDPEKVYFHGNFGKYTGKESAGKMVPIGKQFEWADRHWEIPAVYLCSEGIVIDYCMRLEKEKALTLIQKVNLDQDNDICENFTHEQQREIEFENPLSFRFEMYIELNGEKLQFSHGCGASYHPCLPDWAGSDMEAEKVARYYGLDPTYVWRIYRYAFSWNSKRQSYIRKLTLVMEACQEAVPGPHFKVHSSGEAFQFLHPVNGTTYTVTVQKYEKKELPEECIRSDRFVYPKYFISMVYTLFPQTSERIEIVDTDACDQPYEAEAFNEQLDSTDRGNLSVNVAESDEPGTVRMIEKEEEKIGMVHSALHFKPVQHDVEWCITFYRKQFEDRKIILI